MYWDHMYDWIAEYIPPPSTVGYNTLKQFSDKQFLQISALNPKMSGRSRTLL